MKNSTNSNLEDCPTVLGKFPYTDLLCAYVVFADGTIKERPYFVAAIDKLNRHILGFNIGFGSVGWPETMQCLRHVLSDKSYVEDKYPFVNNEWNAFGVPGTIVVDNGLEFKNGAMKDACLQLGVNLQYAPPRVPEWKGSIERFFGTNAIGFSHKLPGTTRSNPQKLAEGENPKDKACIPFNVLVGLLHKWIIDIYSQDYNKGAGGIPAKLWEKQNDDCPVGWPNSTHELPILLGRLNYRIISNRGIEFKHMHYNSMELNKVLRSFTKENRGVEQKFKVKYDPLNLGSVYLYDHLFAKQWIKVPNVCPEYAEGLSEWEHEESTKLAMKKFGEVDIVALAKAKRFLREEAAVWTSKYRQRKAAKMQSDQEIFGDYSKNYNQSTLKVDYKLPQESRYKTVSHSDISDLGTTYEPSEDIFITPGSLTVIEQSSENKLPAKKKRKKVSVPRLKELGSSEELYREDEDLSPIDLTGFEVISNFEGNLS